MPTVTWSKTGDKEPIASRHNKLEIRKATYNDSGNYVCTAKSILGEVQKQVKLFVEGKYILVKTVCHTQSEIVTAMTLYLIFYFT